MGHQNKRSLHQQAYDVLQSKCGFGRSKQQDKALKITDQYIYSYSTMKTYLKASNAFITWCKANKPKTREIADLSQYVEDYIKHLTDSGKSAYTVKMGLSALSKLYGCKFEIETPRTSRADIKRSRGTAVRDSHFSEERNADLVNVCRCVGFRRFELQKAKSTDLEEINGQWYMNIVGKGGKSRKALICGTSDEIARAILYIRTLDGNNKIHSAADVHSYRSDYATRVYLLNAEKGDLSHLRGKTINYTELTGKTSPKGEKLLKSALYYCRNDKKGTVYDRRAMVITSQMLGHNRESVVGEHYLRL